MTFEKCPPVRDGVVCAIEDGQMCAMAMTCCVKAPVLKVEALASRGDQIRTATNPVWRAA